jgi:hypothetical protein
MKFMPLVVYQWFVGRIAPRANGWANGLAYLTRSATSSTTPARSSPSHTISPASSRSVYPSCDFTILRPRAAADRAVHRLLVKPTRRRPQRPVATHIEADHVTLVGQPLHSLEKAGVCPHRHDFVGLTHVRFRGRAKLVDVRHAKDRTRARALPKARKTRHRRRRRVHCRSGVGYGALTGRLRLAGHQRLGRYAIGQPRLRRMLHDGQSPSCHRESAHLLARKKRRPR